MDVQGGLGWRRWIAAVGMLAVLGGCRRGGEAKPAGSDLPVTSAKSVALPGATDAADAPRAPEVAESATATLTRYQDPATGVSFEYPSVWRPAVAGQSPVEPGFVAQVGKARITQEFLPEGNVYASTVLRGLMFSYTVKEGSTAETCRGVASTAAYGAPTHKAAFGGRSFDEGQGSDGGACTQIQSVVDTTLVGRRCFVFERDFVTSCPYVKSKTEPRPLTAGEQAALQRHLDAVMASVRLDGR